MQLKLAFIGSSTLANSHICLLTPNLKTLQFPKTFRLLFEVAKAEQLRRGQQELEDQREEPHSDFFDVSEWGSIVAGIELHHNGVAERYTFNNGTEIEHHIKLFFESVSSGAHCKIQLLDMLLHSGEGLQMVVLRRDLVSK